MGASKHNTLTGNKETKSIPLLGDSFLYIHTSSKTFGTGVFVSFQRTDITHFGIITFYYDRYSTPTSSTPASKGNFRIHLLIDGNWQTRYTVGTISGFGLVQHSGHY